MNTSTVLSRQGHRLLQIGIALLLLETAIKGAAYSSAPTGLIVFVLILWGLRRESGST